MPAPYRIRDIGRWLFIGILFVFLPAKLFFFDAWHWMMALKSQPDAVLHVPQLVALMSLEIVLQLSLIVGSLFAGIKLLKRSRTAKVVVLYLILAVFAYYLAWPFFSELTKLLPSFLDENWRRPYLEVWIPAAAWTFGALLVWYFTFPTAPPNPAFESGPPSEAARREL
jgi:hypothetical protein